MKLVITMDLDNAAFEDGGTEEVSRILMGLCERLPEPLRPTSGEKFNLHDANGNHCGAAEIVASSRWSPGVGVRVRHPK